MLHQSNRDKDFESLHLWVFVAYTTHICLPGSFKIKSFLELFRADLSLTVRRAAVNVVTMESFVKH